MTKRANLFSKIEAIPDVLQASHLPSLDGLRAVSILIVVVFHVLISYKTRFSFTFFNFANLGVQFFFVISGFLITTLLIKEKIVKGDISLKNFYIRRFFRIVPVAYLYLTAVLLLNLVLNLHMHYVYLVASFLFVRNFFQTATGIDHLSSHYWSLSVEEQFYLLFPCILKWNYYVYICFTLGIIALSLLLDCLGCFGGLHFGGIAGMDFLIQVITQFQGIVVGSLASVMLFKMNFSFDNGSKTVVNAGLLLVIFLLALYEGPFSNGLNIIKCTCFAMILIINLTASDSLIFRILNSGPMKLIGVLSYSIYIWQQPLTQGLSTMNKSRLLSGFANKLPVDIAITAVSLPMLCVISYLSYFYFEKKFLRLRLRFR
jgi:peptidoglycan/LPS O-acetylase OafA/YrhL